jgi:capsule biosynthesis phosphatase
LNIFILCNGLGQRFKDENYFYPKPLVRVNGQHLIFGLLDEIYSKDNNYKVFIIYNELLDSYEFKNLINNRYFHHNIQFLRLGDTRGSAETLHKGIEHFNIRDSFISIDCDIIFSINNLDKFRTNPNNTIFYFRDENDKPIYSYVQLNDNNVTDIAEKHKISNFACCGMYGFNNSNDYVEAFNKLELDKGECYISSIYKNLINTGIPVIALEVENYHCLGTPLLLQNYCLNNKSKEKKRICFDIDNTLFTLAIDRDYNNIEPIEKNINLLKNLYNDGHIIILYTARNMKSLGGNMGLVNKQAGQQIFNLLNKYDIQYHEIYFGKPHADFYIDDLAVNAFSDTQKEMGIYFNNNESRKHNKLSFNNNVIIKETGNSGEIYWYQNIPETIRDFLPDILFIKDNKIGMERIDGTNLSHININKQLTENHISLLFNNLDKIHNSVSNLAKNVNIYANYGSKLKSRMEHDYYQKIKNHDEIYSKIYEILVNYEKHDLGQIGVVHGDTVLTNIFLCRKNNKEYLKFIDMRGRLGEENSIFGDIFYDYAKLYQSLAGYDFIFNSLPLDNEYIKKNIAIFNNLFLEEFDKERLELVRKISASLLYSMLPFHENIEKREKYLDLSLKLLYT